MPRQGASPELQLRRTWVWMADADRRWLRAFRLLLEAEPAESAERMEEETDDAACRAVCPGLDRSPSREPDDRAAAGALQAEARQRGWTIPPAQIYRDDGVSGARLDRPALDRLRDAIGQGQVDVLLITSPDRLARRYAYQVWLLEEFERAGCTVTFLDRPPTGDPQDALVIQIRGAVAEYERAVIADRTRRGRLAALRAGRLLPWSTPPLGYRVDPRAPRDPAGVRVDEAGAATVRQIYAWYLEEGLTLYTIAQRL